MLITGADLKSTLENIDSYPNISPWIGDRGVWVEILNGIVGDAIGGQRRRLGRFLFANSITTFLTALRSQVQALTAKSSIADTTFHICCGLAGGTGSGSIIDVIAQIRELYRPNQTNKYRILLYLLLPEKQPKPNWDSGNYYANGYAAVMELNALSTGAFSPHDVSGQSAGRLTPQTPFDGCYIYTNENENGVTVDVENELPDIIADFLFQKIVAANTIAWTTLRRQEDAENGDGNPEIAPGSPVGERSKRFLAFGIRRLAVPETEIKEYLTYSFAQQAALQLKFNNWSDDVGFKDEPKNRTFTHSYGKKVYWRNGF